MKIQFRIINKGKGKVVIMPSDLHKVCSCCDENTGSTNTVITAGQKLIFKSQGNTNNKAIEINDTVIGIVEGQFLNAGTYYGGDPLMLASYENTEIESVGEIVSFDSENYLTYILRDEIFTRENAAYLSNVTLNVSPPSGLSFDVQIYPGQATELINPMASYVVSEIAIPIGSILILKDNLGEFADSEPFTVNILDTIKENIFDIKRLVDGELFIYPKRGFNPQGNYYMVQKDDQGIDVASRFFNEQYSLNGISSDLESGELIWQLQMSPPFYGYYVIIDTDTGKEISNKYTIPQ